MISYKKNSPYPYQIGGFVVPKEFIAGCSLTSIERILGFRKERLKQGAIFVQLNSLPKKDELEYFGDTRVPSHQFESRRTKEISKKDLSKAAYGYFQPNTILIKVVPADDPRTLKKENQFWPAGQGAMQYKLKEGIKKSAKVVDVISDYPNGIFKG